MNTHHQYTLTHSADPAQTTALRLVMGWASLQRRVTATCSTSTKSADADVCIDRMRLGLEFQTHMGQPHTPPNSRHSKFIHHNLIHLFKRFRNVLTISLIRSQETFETKLGFEPRTSGSLVWCSTT